MSKTMVLRFRDFGFATIEEHISIIGEFGYVWWGWWGKPDESIPRDTFAQYKQQIEKETVKAIFLIDSGNTLLYKAELSDISEADITERASPEQEKTPAYYSGSKHKAWFKLVSISECEDAEIRNWTYDESIEIIDDPHREAFIDKQVFSLKEMVDRRHTTIYFIQEFDSSKHHQHEVRLEPPIRFRNFNKEPQFVNSDYIVHISDLHFFDTHSNFRSPSNLVDKSIQNAIRDDLQTIHESYRPPAAILISGDLTAHATPDEFQGALDFVREFKSALDIEVSQFVIVPGNHDISWAAVDSEFSDETKSKAFNNYCAFYRDLFGTNPDKYAATGRRFVLDNFVAVDVIGLNSTLLEKREFRGYGYVSMPQFVEAARENMSWPASDSIYQVILLHHHIMPINAEEAVREAQSYSMTLDAGQIAYTALKLNVDLVCHGHGHQPFLASIQRNDGSEEQSLLRYLAVSGAGSVSADQPNLGAIGKNSYTIYEFAEGGVKVRVRRWSDSFSGFEKYWEVDLVKSGQGGLRIGG